MSLPDVVPGAASGASGTGPSDAGIITLVALVVHIASFAFSLGPVVCTMINGIGESATFWLSAALCVVCRGWVWKKVPETKGLSLEQIEQMWARQTK